MGLTNTKRRVIVYLMGGLGNVLFQINYAHNLRSRGFDVVLNGYLLNENFITKKILGWSSHDTLSLLKDLDVISLFKFENRITIYFLLGLLSKIVNKNIFSCQYFGLAAPECENLKATHLFGYFHIKNPICSEFVSIVKRAIANNICRPDLKRVKENLRQIGTSWVIHIRGGDYKFDQNFAIDMDYYIEATKGKDNFYVITNDRNYSEKVLSNINLKFDFVCSNDALEDFLILTISNNKILANSTFSWWAAELGSENSLIIQPEPFFKHLNWRPETTKRREFIQSQPDATL